MDSLRASKASRALGWLLAILALSSLWRFGDAWPGIDYYQFWLVGRAMQAEPALDPYPAATRQALGEQGVALARQQQGSAREPSLQLRVAEYRKALEVYSTPLLYSVVGGFTQGDYASDKQNWQRAMLLCFCLAVLCTALALGLAWSEAGLCIAVALVANEALLAELGNGNVNALLALSLGLCLLAVGRDRLLLAGLCWSVGLCFKPLLALAILPLVLRWLWARQWRALGYAALGVALGLALGMACIAIWDHPLRLWAAWWSAASELARNSSDYPDNFAPWAWLKNSLGLDLPRGLLWFAVGALCALRAARARATPANAREAVQLLAFGAVLALLLAPLLWIHYLLLAMPWILALVFHGRWWMGGLALVAALCLASQPLTQLFEWRTHAERSPAVVLALLLLVGLGAWKLEPERTQ